jgi:hypothetical protein
MDDRRARQTEHNNAQHAPLHHRHPFGVRLLCVGKLLADQLTHVAWHQRESVRNACDGQPLVLFVREAAEFFHGRSTVGNASEDTLAERLVAKEFAHSHIGPLKQLIGGVRHALKTVYLGVKNTLFENTLFLTRYFYIHAQQNPHAPVASGNARRYSTTLPLPSRRCQCTDTIKK